MRPEHRWTRNNLSPYMDGELSPSDAARAERHLRECAECQRELDSLCQVTNLLRQVPTKAVPRPFFISQKMATERHRLRTRSRVYGTFRTASVLATLLLLFVIGGDLLFFGGLGLLPGLERPATAPVVREFAAVEQVLDATVPAAAEKQEARAVFAAAEEQQALAIPTPGIVAQEQEAGPTGGGGPVATPSPMAFAAAPSEADSSRAAEMGVAATAPPAEEPVAAPEPTPEAGATLTTAPDIGILAHAQPTEPPPELSAPVEREHPSRPDLSLSRLRSIELILLGVVVVLVIATLVLRRIARRL